MSYLKSPSCYNSWNLAIDHRAYVVFLVGHEEPFLFVLNNGDNALTLKVNVSSANKTYENIQIPKHDFKQVEFSSPF